MKVGILTFHSAKNYGAVLQTFALQHSLKLMGVDAFIIDRYSGHKSLIHQIYWTFHPRVIVQRLSWLSFDQFSKKYLIPKTKEYNTSTSLIAFNKTENFDAVIVGSDQVWRMEFSLIGYNYFFDFLDGNNIRKISYAASFGKDKWEESDKVTAHVKKLLNDFSSISVREKSGVNICAETFNTQAIQVLDPTLLLTKEDYESIVLKNSPVAFNKNLVSYLLGEKQESLKYCDSFAKTNHLGFLDLYHIYPISSSFSASEFGEKRHLHVSVPEWLAQIRNAQYIITNSFHATIFSILFRKQFIVVDHPSGGTDRIISILELLGLNDRFVSNVSEISIELFQKSIDWNSVHELLNREKERSISFLHNSLF